MEDPKNVLLVVNPIAGGIDKAELISRAKEYTAQRNINLNIYKTTGNQDREKIIEILNTFTAHRVLIAGGDGTVKLLAETLLDHTIPIGILATGSANGLARSLDLVPDLDEALDVALGNRLIDIDAICVNDYLCLHVSDLGLNAELIKHYESGNIRGKLGYFIQSIPTLLQSDMPFTFEVSVENQTFHKEGILLAIANARKYGTGAVINPVGKINDGKFEVLIFKKFDVIEILKTLSEEAKPDPDFVESISTTQAKIYCRQPVPFQVDGEYYGEVQHLNVSILPKHLKIAVGR